MSDGASRGEVIVYQTEDGRNRILVRLQNETVWLPQMALAELFETTKQNISLHIRNILDDRELEEGTVVKEYLTTAADGKQYRVARLVGDRQGAPFSCRRMG